MTSNQNTDHSASAQHGAASVHSTSDAPAQYGSTIRKPRAQYGAVSHACSDFDPRLDVPIPYRLHSSAWPIGYRLAAQDADELPMRARKAGAL